MLYFDHSATTPIAPSVLSLMNGLNQKMYTVNKPIGQKFVAVEKTFPYTVNPYNITSYDTYLEKFNLK